jgi:hypothetical protein
MKPRIKINFVRVFISFHGYRCSGFGCLGASKLVEVIGPSLHHPAPFRQVFGVVVSGLDRVALGV